MEDLESTRSLLAACKKCRGRFTMHEVLQHLVAADQALVVTFSDAWVHLMEKGVIRMASGDEPETYELVYQVSDRV